LQRHPSPTSRLSSIRGFTIPELIVSSVVVLLVTVVITPQLLHSREIAHQQSCRTNLKELGAALWGYQSANSVFPVMFSTNQSIYPYLTSAPRITKTGFKGAVIIGEGPSPSVLRCPTDADTYVEEKSLSYCWCWGAGPQKKGVEIQSDGLFSGVPVSPARITDGMGFTAATSETRVFNWEPEFLRRKAWLVGQSHPGPLESSQFREDCLNVPQDEEHFSPGQQRGSKWGNDLYYYHSLTPYRPSCENIYQENGVNGSTELWTANSEHPGGVYLLMVDGSVRFISESIDEDLWTALSTRAGNETIEW
jgi:type II secretory pathway pseudopilin PulG